MQQVKSVTIPWIKEFEKVRIESFDSYDNSTIYLEKFSTQLEVYCMLCFHIFS